MRRLPCCYARFLLHNSENVIRFFTSFANGQHGANNSPHHIPQKPVCRNGKDHPIINVLPLCCTHVANIRFCLGLSLAKRCEISLSDQKFCGGVHSFQIEFSRMVNGVGIAEWVFTEMDKVIVTSGVSAKARVKIAVHRHYSINGNIHGQNRIHFKTEILGQIHRGVKMQKVRRRVNACIGSTAAHYPAQILHKNGQRLFHFFLHGIYSRLHLPSTIITSVVSQLQKISRQLFFFAANVGEASEKNRGNFRYAWAYGRSDSAPLKRMRRNLACRRHWKPAGNGCTK